MICQTDNSSVCYTTGVLVLSRGSLTRDQKQFDGTLDNYQHDIEYIVSSLSQL